MGSRGGEDQREEEERERACSLFALGEKGGNEVGPREGDAKQACQEEKRSHFGGQDRPAPDGVGTQFVQVARPVLDKHAVRGPSDGGTTVSAPRVSSLLLLP